MANVNYRQLRSCLENRREYVHGSSYAKRNDTEYQVWSYSTLMLAYNCVQGRVTYFNDGYYSATTSRLQNMIRLAFDVTTVPQETTTL